MDPELIRTIVDVRRRVDDARMRGRHVALVPTMGALHAGHGALIDRARQEADTVIVSIFVNPIQFDRADDFERYARVPEQDLEFCASRRVDLVFAPEVEEMYPAPQRTFVEVAGVSDYLCGAFRPGHFRGVATVVMKLFNIVHPHSAYFGQKDAQQLAVIRRMVADLDVAVKIVPVPTVREPDGLALSSRNVRLTAEERRVAPALHRALEFARCKVAQGCVNAAEVRDAATALLRQEERIRVEYFEVVDADEMQPVERISGRVCIAAAIWLGGTRLIDNVLCEATGCSTGRSPRLAKEPRPRFNYSKMILFFHHLPGHSFIPEVVDRTRRHITSSTADGERADYRLFLRPRVEVQELFG
jgi:pantoate--beta-alanine ligase